MVIYFQYLYIAWIIYSDNDNIQETSYCTLLILLLFYILRELGREGVFVLFRFRTETLGKN